MATTITHNHNKSGASMREKTNFNDLNNQRLKILKFKNIHIKCALVGEHITIEKSGLIGVR